MHFIRISTLQQQFPAFRFPVTEDRSEAFREAFYAHELARKNSIPENEQWLMRLQSEEFVLFMNWTEQERELAELLEGSDKLVPFRDTTRLTSHALFGRFQAFVTPFLYPRLGALLKESILETWNVGLTYLVLLQEREADLIQNGVYAQLKVQQDALEQAIRVAKTEEQLFTAIRPYLTPQFLATLNRFTLSFYRVKTNWVEQLRRIADHPAGTNRLVLHLIKELNQLQLNPDHVRELRQLERDLKVGSVRVETTKISTKRVLLLSGSILLVGALIWLILSVPSGPERDQPQERTAFMDFSVQERKTIDSLLQHIKMEREQSENIVDGSDMTYVGEDLVVKIPRNNQDAEYLISHWEEKDSINRTPQTADSKKEDRTFPMTESLKDKKGTIQAKFQNDTDLSVLVLVYKDRVDEWVYSQYIEKNAIVSFKLYPEEHLIVVPGSKVPKHLNAGALPFEQVDSRFFENLGKEYIVDDLSPAHAKLVWKALNNFDFYLLDVNGALNM